MQIEESVVAHRRRLRVDRDSVGRPSNGWERELAVGRVGTVGAGRVIVRSQLAQAAERVAGVDGDDEVEVVRACVDVDVAVHGGRPSVPDRSSAGHPGVIGFSNLLARRNDLAADDG
jgi:hypothetical protein